MTAPNPALGGTDTERPDWSAHIARLIAEAPRLTDEKRDRIAAIMRGGAT